MFAGQGIFKSVFVEDLMLFLHLMLTPVPRPLSQFYQFATLLTNLPAYKTYKHVLYILHTGGILTTTIEDMKPFKQ